MNVKTASIGGGLFGLGALFGWAVTADWYDHKNEERFSILEDQVATLRRRANNAYEGQMNDGLKYRSKVEHLEGQIEVLKAENALLTGEGSVQDTDETADEETQETVEETRSNLKKLIDSYSPEGSSAEEFSEEATRAQQQATPPFVISEEEFAHGEDGFDYDKITLTYYPRHRILLDDEDDPVDDVAFTAGWRNLSAFGRDSTMDDTVYIRNHAMRTDFEVVKDEEELPLHIKYGMRKEEFLANTKAGLIKLRPEDRD